MFNVPKNITDQHEIEQYLMEQARQQAQVIAEERKKEVYFANLFKKVAEETGESISSTDVLIKRLLPYASKSKISSGDTGRSERFKATRELIERAKQVYAETNSIAKAGEAIGATYPTARKAVTGGFDKKVGLA
jgi:hypothetical protein